MLCIIEPVSPNKTELKHQLRDNLVHDGMQVLQTPFTTKES